MIDEKFSVSAFESSRGDKTQLRALANLLQDQIQTEVDRLLGSTMRQIIEKLNRLGHNLRPYDPPEKGHIAYRDDTDDEIDYDCKLRVALDFTVSVGYADVRYSKSNPEGEPVHPEE